MKSSEAREICAKTRSGSEAQLYQTVMECIADRAKTGSESATVYLQTLWHKDLVNAVKKRLKEEGYRVKYSYIDDQRDGDCHVLDISWREDIINKKANPVIEDSKDVIEPFDRLIESLRIEADTYEKSGGNFPVARLDKDEKKLQATMYRHIANRVEKSWNSIKGHILPLSYWGFLKYDEAVCSNCGTVINAHFYTTSEAKEHWCDLPNYCENCGACMDHSKK